MNPAIMVLSETLKANQAKLRMTGLLLDRKLFNMLCEHILAKKFPLVSYCWVYLDDDDGWRSAYVWGVTIYPKDHKNEHSGKDPD